MKTQDINDQINTLNVFYKAKCHKYNGTKKISFIWLYFYNASSERVFIRDDFQASPNN